MKFSTTQFPMDLVTFTEEICSRKLTFCAVYGVVYIIQNCRYLTLLTMEILINY